MVTCPDVSVELQLNPLARTGLIGSINSFGQQIKGRKMKGPKFTFVFFPQPCLTLGPIFFLLIKSPELGAQPSVYLAVAEELASVSGRYYDVMKEKEPAPQALNQEVAVKLWDISASLVGLETTVSGPTTSPETVTQVLSEQTRIRPSEPADAVTTT